MTQEQIDRLFAEIQLPCSRGPRDNCRRCAAEKALRALLAPLLPTTDPATIGCATCGEKGWPHYDRMPSGIWICSECHHAIRTHYAAPRAPSEGEETT